MLRFPSLCERGVCGVRVKGRDCCVQRADDAVEAKPSETSRLLLSWGKRTAAARSAVCFCSLALFPPQRERALS